MAEPVSHLICNLHHKLPGLIFLPRQLISCVQCAHLNPQNIFHYGLSEGGVGNYHEIPKLMRNKIEKRHVKKNNHTYKTVFMWFGNLFTSTELQRFYYYQGKIQSATV